MWSWPNHSPSNLNPNFQTVSQFSASTFPSNSPHSTSQQSLLPSPFHAPPTYQHPDYTSTLTFPSPAAAAVNQQLHSPAAAGWQHPIPSLEPSRIMSPSINSSLQPPPDLHHKHRHPELTTPINNSASSLHLASGGGVALVAPQETARFHNSTPSNSPFSVDFLLQKSAPSPHETTVGTYSDQYASEQQSSYPGIEYHAPSATSHYEAGGLTHAGYHGGHTPVLTPQHMEQVPSENSLSSSISHRPYERTSKHYSETLPPPFPLVTGFANSAPPPHCNDEPDKFCIPSSEEPYSPPGLILKDDSHIPLQANEDNGGNAHASIPPAHSHHPAHASIPPAHSHRPAHAQTGGSFPGIDEDEEIEDEDEGAQDGKFSGGFQLGVTPPSAQEINERPKSLVNAKYESSNSSDGDETHPQSLPQDDVEGEVPMEELPMPPPLVPVETSAQEKSGYYDDDDDVFLPLPPKQSPPIQVTPTQKSTIAEVPKHETTPQSATPVDSSDTDTSSLPRLIKGERKSPTMVIGRRGRAAGKVLDEGKLRLPLEKGWQRVVRARIAEGNTAPRVDICYVTPCNRRLRTFPEIQRYLMTNSITDLTIDHFTFSKKVNVGMVIDERTALDNIDNPLIHPRRGRPPKRLKMAKPVAEDFNVSENTNSSRISLEPHEIRNTAVTPINETSLPVSTVTVPPTHSFSAHMSEEQHTITKVVNDKAETAHTVDDPTHVLPQATPPLLTSSSVHVPNADIKGPAVKESFNGGLDLNENKRKETIKRPRGRPKGSGTKGKLPESAGSGATKVPTPSSRKGRKPKHIVHIPPSVSTTTSLPSSSQSTLPHDNNSSSLYQDTLQSSSSNGKESSTSGLRPLLPKMETPSQNDGGKVRVIKKQEDKKRQLLHANKAKKRAESQRRLSQQTRRQRERALIKQAKERMDRLNKQKEADWQQLRKSRIAKQKEEANQLKARERTLKLLEEIQQREQENDRMTRLRQLEREKAEQLRRPTEDLLVNDLMTLPLLTKLEWVSLPSHNFANFVMVFEFSHSFEDFLEMERVPTFPELYAGLFNAAWTPGTRKEEEKEGDESDDNSKRSKVGGLMLLTVQLVKAVVHDGGARTYTCSGLPLRDIDVKEDTVSEVLRLYLQNRRNHTLQDICSILNEFPYHSLCPNDKTAVLVYLVDELLSSVSLCREIDNRMEQIATLRRDKWKISLKLKRFRSHLTDTYGVHQIQKPVVYSGRGRPPKRAFLNTGPHNEDADSSDEEGVTGSNETEEAADDDVYFSEEESDEDAPVEKEELQKRIKELKKKFILVRGRINTVTRLMRKFPLGQDRFTRQYWNLPEMGGVLVEGMETSHNEYLETLFPRFAAEEAKRLEKKRTKRKNASSRANGGTRESLSPSFSHNTVESRATSEIPLSTQSSPYPPTSQGAWLTDSPAKYSDDTDMETLATPTKTATPTKMGVSVEGSPSSLLSASTLKSHAHLEEPSPEKQVPPPPSMQHPLEVQLSAKQGKNQDVVTMETDSSEVDGTTSVCSSEDVNKTVSLATSLSLECQSKGSSSSPSIVTTFLSSNSSSSCVSTALTTTTTSSSSSSHAPVSSLHNMASTVSPWFSLLPRKPCELLHYIQSNNDLQHQQAALLNGSQYLMSGGYAAYIAPDGTTVLGQPVIQQVQVGYAMVGNTLVPQTQYIIGQNPSALGATTATALGATAAAAVGGGQYISLPNGQLALAAAGSNVQYANIGGNQYAIIQAPQEEATATGSTERTNVNGQQQLETKKEPLVSSGVEALAVSAETTTVQERAVESEKKKRKKKMKDTSSAATVASTSTAAAADTQQQQFITLALPTGSDGETQYCQVPADPRVLSGQYSYAIMPQGDGISQIVLVENSSLAGVGVALGNGETMEMECPPSSIMDNEYEGRPWMVDITLMYADTPLPFVGSENVVEEKKEEEKPLKELLQEIDTDLTKGWWTVNSSLEIDYLLRCMTMRGYREKSLHKLFQKNKDNISAALQSNLLTTPPFVDCNEKGVNKESHDKIDTEPLDNEKAEPENNEKAEPHNNEKAEPHNDERAESHDNEMMVSQNVNGEGTESHDTEQMDLKIDVDSRNDEPVTPDTDGISSSNADSTELMIVHDEPLADTTTTGDKSLSAAVAPSPVSATSFFPLEAGKLACTVMEYLQAMENRLFDAHLQLKGVLKVTYQEQFSTAEDHSFSAPNLLTIAKRLLKLESCVQRRYLKPPFKEKHQPADARKDQSVETNEPVSPPPEPVALTKWKEAIAQATSTSQLAVYINQLEKCIAWEKSPMKVFCVVCQTGDNESLLLLCDRCDRGTHTYCCRPKLDSIPDGDWYCHNCTINASRKIVCGVCQSSRGSLLHCTECPKVFHKRCLNPPLTKMPSVPWACMECRREHRRKPGRPRGSKDDLILCQSLLMDLEEQDDAWPFLEPVSRKKIPNYYRVIKRPMDFQTVKQKLREGKYSNKDSFAFDIRLIFDNCSFYNEDDSQIGMAGHAMRLYFEKKWTEMMQK